MDGDIVGNHVLEIGEVEIESFGERARVRAVARICLARCLAKAPT